MKKIFFLIVLIALCLPLSCQNKTYLIRGKIENWSSEVELIFNDWGIKESENISVKNGVFEIKGELEEGTYPRAIYLVLMKKGSFYGNDIILEPGEIVISFDKHMKITIGGTPENENLQKLNDIFSKYDDTSASNAWREAYDKKAPEHELEELWKITEDIRNEARETKLKVLLENDNYASLVLTPPLIRNEGANIIGQFMKQFERFSYTKDYKNLKNSYEIMSRCTDGALVKDFTLPAPDGKMVSLSDFRGKWVLLDFWYVGCPWCRKLTPNLNKIYEEYKENLEIISISIDKESNRERMIKVIEDDKMVWTQVNDNAGKELPDYFGVGGYPSLYLIDPQGRGIAKREGYCETGGLRRFLNKYIK